MCIKILYVGSPSDTVRAPDPSHATLDLTFCEGFTVLELLVVTVIMGILATLAIMVLLSFRKKAGVATVSSDLKSAYEASGQYHTDYPTGTVTMDVLRSYDFRASKDVNLTVVDGGTETVNITATHPTVGSVYQVDQDGRISKQ